jgi:hypothetical protein
LDEREYLKDQRLKIGPKGRFQLGTVDQRSVLKDRRTAALRDRIDVRIQHQTDVSLYKVPSTSTQELPWVHVDEDLGEVMNVKDFSNVFQYSFLL